MEEGGAPSALEDGSALAQRVPSDMEEGCAPSALEDGSVLRAPPTALRAPSDMEEGCAPSVLEDGSALRAPPTALVLALGVGSALEEREGDEDAIAAKKLTTPSGVVWFVHGVTMSKPYHSRANKRQESVVYTMYTHLQMQVAQCTPHPHQPLASHVLLQSLGGWG